MGDYSHIYRLLLLPLSSWALAENKMRYGGRWEKMRALTFHLLTWRKGKSRIIFVELSFLVRQKADLQAAMQGGLHGYLFGIDQSYNSDQLKCNVNTAMGMTCVRKAGGGNARAISWISIKWNGQWYLCSVYWFTYFYSWGRSNSVAGEKVNAYFLGEK